MIRSTQTPITAKDEDSLVLLEALLASAPVGIAFLDGNLCVVRINEAPQIHVTIVNSGAPMGGAGEPGTPPIAPAVTNAIFAATDKRIRRLPIAKNFA